MPRVVKIVLFAIFFIVLIVLAYLGYQYFLLTNNLSGTEKPLQSSNNLGVVQNVTNTIKNLVPSTGSKIILLNSATNYSLVIQDKTELEKLLENLQIFEGNEKKIERVEITTVDNLQTGIEQRLDDKVWMKMDSRVENGVFKISTRFDVDTMKSFKNADWNKLISQVILIEFQNQSPLSANSTSAQRINSAGSLVKAKSESNTNKYYFEINF